MDKKIYNEVANVINEKYFHSLTGITLAEYVKDCEEQYSDMDYTAEDIIVSCEQYMLTMPLIACHKAILQVDDVCADC